MLRMRHASRLARASQIWGIAFTGHSDDLVRYTDWEGNEVVRTLIPCPSEWDRSLKTINMWGGNRPWKDEGVNEYPDQEYDSALDNL